MNEPLIFFDGVCRFCDRSVQFIIKRDSRKLFKFAPLQGPTAARLLGPDAGNKLDSIVLLENGKRYDRSTAALKILSRLDWFWPVCTVLLIVPRPIRDWVYDGFALRRYNWFGRYDSCPIPTPELRARFVD